jgi:crotonobetainyl-CoA:carnitine CoA-transferase CaiB-like acyl-CoA transferase
VLLGRLGEAPSLPLRGSRVANLASLWAGPLAADVLRRLGADVVSVESAGRPDGARATPAWHASLHAGQRSVALNLGDDQGVARLAALLRSADVVIEGSRPRALEQLGIDAAEVVGAGPQVWVSITGHGRRPPGSTRIAFGDDAAVAGGLFGRLGDGPMFLADAVADPLAGLTAAATVVDLLERGGRWIVDVALSRVAASAAARPGDPVVEARAPAHPPRPGVVDAVPVPLGQDTSHVLTEWGVDL